LDKRLEYLLAERILWERKRSKLSNNFLVIDLYMKLAFFIFFLPSILWLSDKKTDIYLNAFASATLLFYLIIFLTSLLRLLNDYYYKLPRYQKKIDEIDYQIAEIIGI